MRALGTTNKGGRDIAIDAVRGLCIISMVTAHVAVGSLAWRSAHAEVWVDGAMGFVLLAGLVIGMVQSRTNAKPGGGAAGRDKLARRLGLLYLSYLFVALLAFTMGATTDGRDLPSTDAEGGLGAALWSTLTLQINPRNAAILSLYVVLFALAFGAVWYLRRGKAWTVLGVSAVLYVAGQVFPEAATFPRDAASAGTINWSTWQLMFMLAFVLGWRWREPSTQRTVLDDRVALGAAAVVVVLSVFAQARERGYIPDTGEAVIDRIFGGDTLGVGAMLMAFATCLVRYRVLRWPVMRGLAVPLATLGRRSLDCYLWLCVFVLVVVRQEPYATSATGANVVVLAVLSFQFAWIFFRDRFGGPVEWSKAAWADVRGARAPSASKVETAP